MIVFASMILEAWKFDSEPIENQLEFEAPDFWLTLERADVAERTERPDSELIEDKAEIEKFRLLIFMSYHLCLGSRGTRYNIIAVLSCSYKIFFY